ncbi:DNA-binding protein [Acetobacter musti]|uniref:DNA-binding protein n=2 Tax=Acetobacter musti TaxID=864732 RepID=A0ABX0JSM4_9PROT|nr:DNA-binding protein [Acetobacter musti]
MSSREIATLTGSSHDNVLKTIRALVKKGLVSGNETPYVHPQNGQTYQEFSLDYRNTMVVVSGYSVELRARIIDRWMELEAAPATPAIPQTYAAALLEAGRLAEENEKLAAASAAAEDRAKLSERYLAIAVPKAVALDRISTSDGSYGLQEAAKILQVGPKAFVQWLRANRWIYKRPGSTNNLGYQDKINAGYLWHKVSTYENSSGETKTRDDVKILPKGIARLAREVPGAALDSDLSPVPVASDATANFRAHPEPAS